MSSNTIRLNTSAIPPDGWHYWQQIPNSDSVQLKGSRPQDVVDKVKQFRIDNGILPVGDPMADLIDYYLKHFPAFVLGVKKGAVPRAPRVGNKLRLLDRVAQWALDMTQKQGTEYAYEDQSKQRANICLNCPKNRQWRTCSACGDLTNATDRRINIILGSRGKFPGLLGCQSSGHDNQAAVWVNSGLTRGHDAPANCWVGQA